MKQKVIASIAQQFTTFWVKSQNNPKIDGFNDNAEICRKDILMHKIGFYLSIISFWVSLGLLVLAQNEVEELVVGKFVIGFFSLIMFIILTVFWSPGDTSKKITKEWIPVRRKLLKYGIVQRITKTREGSKDMIDVSGLAYGVGEKSYLVRAFDESMKALYEKMRNYQRNGFPKKEAKTLKAMIDLRSLTNHFGIKMNFSSYELPEPTVQLKCTCAGYTVDLKH